MVVQFVLLVVWSRRRTERARRIMLAGFVVGPLLVLIQWLVVTEAEQLRATCDSLAAAVQDADVQAFERHLTADFVFDGPVLGRSLDKAAACERLDQQLKRYRVENPRLAGFQIEVTGRQATVSLTARCRVVSADEIEPTVVSIWELTFERVGKRWLLAAARNKALRPGF